MWEAIKIILVTARGLCVMRRTAANMLEALRMINIMVRGL